MKKSEHDNLSAFYHKIDSERKSPEETAPQFAMDPQVEKWIPRDITDAGIEDAQKLLPESGRLCFIPRITANYIFLDLRKEAQAVCHFLFSIAP